MIWRRIIKTRRKILGIVMQRRVKQLSKWNVNRIVSLFIENNGLPFILGLKKMTNIGKYTIIKPDSIIIVMYWH